MSFKNFIIPIMLIFTLALFGCTNTGKELVVGTYNSHDEVVFDKDRIIKDKNSIETVKNIITNNATSASRIEGDPDYVIMINNKGNSTMEVKADLWLQVDGTIIFSRGFENEEFQLISKENSEEIKKILQLK